MKILTAPQIKLADKATIERQNITSAGLMERAANEVFVWLKQKFPDAKTPFHVFCGQGNNGGDGLVIARMLHHANYKVTYEIVENTGNPTEDFKLNKRWLEKTTAPYVKMNGSGIGGIVIIDAIFGTGLSRELSNEVKQVVENINSKMATVIAIDVPSGMFTDKPTDVAVKSDTVLTFQAPKLAFYLPQNKEYIKDIVILDIELDNEYLEATQSNYHFTDTQAALKLYKPMQAQAHKGTQGHAIVIGGSYGKIGAVCLSAKAALESGCGLVTAYIPKCGYDVIQTSFPEAMALTDGQEHITQIKFDFEPKAIGIGPGMGQHPDTQKAIGDFLKTNKTPLVIDADALNILSQNKEWLELLPPDTILTPHPKELERLMGKWVDDFDKLEKMKAFSNDYNLVLVAKDAHTMVVHGDEVHINSTGNAGLATGGSGDVLTGIITGLLAQGYKPSEAAIFGVYLHGLSADIGIKETSMQAFIASDILKYLGSAYLEIDRLTI